MNIDEVRARLQTVEARSAVAAYEARCGRFGEREQRSVLLTDVEVRASGNPDVAFTVVGHAAVYARKSLDLGGFQEIIDKGAFDDVLSTAPDVFLLWDHDTQLVLARTKRQPYTLELSTDPKGLRFYSPVAPTSFAADLQVLMESGLIDQASFAFSDVDDTWTITEVNGVETVVRTIQRIGALYDVTITAQGAYPSTDSSVVRSLAFAYAMDTGRLEGRTTEGEAGAASEVPSEPVEAIEVAKATGDISETVAPDTDEAETAQAVAGADSDSAEGGEVATDDADTGDDSAGSTEADAASDTESATALERDSAGADEGNARSRGLRLAQARIAARVAEYRSALEERTP